MTRATSQLTERLTSPDTGFDPEVWVPLLRLLAQGQPVGLGALVAASGKTMPEVIQALARVPDTEYDDDGQITGQGLTLRRTPHHIEIDGTLLYTWCALDTLIFPTVLGSPARIESVCHGTGVPVRVTIDADGVSNTEPRTAVVSLINPEDLSSVRSAFCNQVHFFGSAEAAEPWLKAHPGGSVIPVLEAYQLGATMVQTLLHGSPLEEPASFTKSAASCC